MEAAATVASIISPWSLRSERARCAISISIGMTTAVGVHGDVPPDGLRNGEGDGAGDHHIFTQNVSVVVSRRWS